MNKKFFITIKICRGGSDVNRSTFLAALQTMELAEASVTNEQFLPRGEEHDTRKDAGLSMDELPQRGYQRLTLVVEAAERLISAQRTENRAVLGEYRNYERITRHVFRDRRPLRRTGMDRPYLAAFTD